MPKNQQEPVPKAINQSQDQVILERLQQVERVQMQQQEDLKTAQTALKRQQQQVSAHVEQCAEMERAYREQLQGRFLDVQMQISEINRTVGNLANQHVQQSEGLAY